MSNTAAARALPLLPRGVFEADYLIRGCRALLAIDRHGNCVKRVRIRPGTDEEVARVWLEGYLERLDPPPRLRLVKLPADRISVPVMMGLIRASASARPPRMPGVLPAMR